MKGTKEYKVSVVTGVYNVEDYLEEMVECLISQTIGFQNIQVILVDDGSADGSGEICDRYAAQYPDNIVVVHKENGGVSTARNEGLNHVRGEFVNFLDADDLLEENALEEMYDFLKKNQKWIDLVSIRMNFFGGREGGHPLNYKYNNTRIVELRKDYKFIQLSMSSALIKAECFKNRRFDTELSYAEDAQLLIDILLDKMRFGVVSEASYLYRRREAGNSAINTGRNRPAYYIPYMERFMMRSLENARKRKGYIPYFVQYTCMYDLQWRLRVNPLVNPDVLSPEEEERYKSLIGQALSCIENKIIDEQKNINGTYKAAVMSFKRENQERRKLEFYPDDVKICIDDLAYTAAFFYTVFYEFIDVAEDYIQIEGYSRHAAELEGVEILIKAKGKGSDAAEYPAELSEREDKYAFFMDKMMIRARNFKVTMDRRTLPKEADLQLCLRYQGHDVLYKTISFGKFFPLTDHMENSFYYHGGVLLTYSENKLKLVMSPDKSLVKKCERNFEKEILSLKTGSGKPRPWRVTAWFLRKTYYFLRHFKRRELWLVSDRLKKADDNGEAFFTYMNQEQKNCGINVYFVLDKDSEDYSRLKKIGKVVPYHSFKYKIMALLCDKVISAQADDYVFRHSIRLAFLYKDILYKQKFVFLQHGVTKDDLSRWLIRTNKNIGLFVTTTHMEYQSILDYNYRYDEKQVKCTGFPRYDCLYDDSQDKKVITFMPTWRSYLVAKHDVDTDSRELYEGFAESTYCQMYRQVFSDPRLMEAAQKNNYELWLMLHPAMPQECVEYFQCADNIKILDRNTRYRELFANSKLIITDYSSTVFDFAYLRKPVLYFQEDVEEFFSGGHTYDKGYFDYERDGFGEVEYTAEDLVSRAIEYMENGCRLKDVYRSRIDQTFPFHDKENSRRVYEEIRKL